MLNNMPNHPNWIGQPMRSPANCSFSRARANAVNTKMWRFWLMKFISSRLSSGIGKTSWPRSYVTSALTSNVPLETKLKILIKIPKSVLEAFSCEDDHNAPVLGKLEVHKIVGTKEKRGNANRLKKAFPHCAVIARDEQNSLDRLVSPQIWTMRWKSWEFIAPKQKKAW